MHVRHPKNVDVSPTDLALTYRQYAQPKKKKWMMDAKKHSVIFSPCPSFSTYQLKPVHHFPCPISSMDSAGASIRGP